MNSIPVVKNKEIIVSCQKKAWCTSDIYLNWLKEIFYNYELFIAKHKCYLIMDKAPSHVDKNILNELKEKKVIYSLIPGGMTRFLQPLDIGVNKQFKDLMKREYLEYVSNVVTNNEIIIENKFKYNDKYKNLTKADIERQNIIRWVYKVWTNEKLITKESIVKSFKKVVFH